eukprot:5402789-Prymnesium_polylepis.1
MGQAAVNLTPADTATFAAIYGANGSSHCEGAPVWTASELMGGDTREGTLPQDAALLSTLRGFYFNLATVTVVVIGDVTPSSLAETAFVLVLILFGVAVHSALIGSIVGVLANLGEEEHARERFVASVRTYMLAYKVPAALQTRVRDYLEASYE